MLSIAFPWAALLLPLPWLVWRLAPLQRVRRVAVRVPFGKRALAAGASLPGLQSATRSALRHAVPALGWILLLAALSRPQWLELPVTREQPARDLLLLVDLSASMAQTDFVDRSGAHVDRLTAVKQVLGEFLERRRGDRLGLVVFGNAAYLQVPFTTDPALARRLLDETAIGMAGPRTALGDAIGLGITLFEHSDAPARTLIALTDGNDTASEVPPAEAARVAHDRGIRIHTVAIGDPVTAGEDRLDEQTLKSVAREGGGRYFFAADRTGLEAIYAELDRIEARNVREISHRPRRELYWWPLLAALVLALAHPLVDALRSLRAQRLRPEAVAIRVDPLTGRLETGA